MSVKQLVVARVLGSGVILRVAASCPADLGTLSLRLRKLQGYGSVDARASDTAVTARSKEFITVDRLVALMLSGQDSDAGRAGLSLLEAGL